MSLTPSPNYANPQIKGKMEKSKKYYSTLFSAKVIRKAHELFLKKLDFLEHVKKPQVLSISDGDTTWKFDAVDEFYAAYNSAENFEFNHMVENGRFRVVPGYANSSVSVDVALDSRPDIEAVFQVFEDNLDSSKIVVESEPVKVFFGHGQDSQWRDLKDHLHEKHGFEVVAYEIGPRAGLSVKEVLNEMLNKSSFALLVLTGEDQDADGKMHARENVIHELGLFQGRLGFTRAVALVERDTEEFSNILGINQIRFSKGNIRESFGDVLATIKREFKKQPH